MQQMAQQQTQQVIIPVPPAAGSQQQGVPTEATAAMISALNDVKLTGTSNSAKKQKQHDVMDHLEEHPQLSGSPATGNNRNQPPGGGGH